VPTVVVGHSLGSVVAYDLMRRDGEREGSAVPLFVTLGSPIGSGPCAARYAPTATRRAWGAGLTPATRATPSPLHPLDTAHFPVDPPVPDRSDIDNTTSNRYGIVGYLADPWVARSIHDALVAG
jgi:hypothetical protein